MTSTPSGAGAEWLAQAHPDPRQPFRDWAHPVKIALLPSGIHWDVVVVPGRAGLDILNELTTGEARPVLADLRQERTYFFVPAGTAGRWSAPGTLALGKSAWVGMPSPDESRATHRRVLWMEPPDGSGALVDRDELAAAVYRVTARHGALAAAVGDWWPR